MTIVYELKPVITMGERGTDGYADCSAYFRIVRQRKKEREYHRSEPFTWREWIPNDPDPSLDHCHTDFCAEESHVDINCLSPGLDAVFACMEWIAKNTDHGDELVLTKIHEPWRRFTFEESVIDWPLIHPITDLARMKLYAKITGNWERWNMASTNEDTDVRVFVSDLLRQQDDEWRHRDIRTLCTFSPGGRKFFGWEPQYAVRVVLGSMTQLRAKIPIEGHGEQVVTFEWGYEDPWIARIAQVIIDIRELVTTSTRPSRVSTYRLIDAWSTRSFVDKALELNCQLRCRVEEAVAHWDAIVERLKTKLSTPVFDSIRMPTAEEFERRFKFEFELANSNRLKLLLDANDGEAIRDPWLDTYAAPRG